MSTQPVSPQQDEMARKAPELVWNGPQESAIGRTYSTWRGLFTRCFNPIDRNFSKYGGRGITVCPRWFDFNVFVEDMGLRPEGKTLDRINNNGNYEPGNCRWATPLEQARNTRRNKVVLVDGKPKFQVEIAREYGLADSTVMRRLQAGTPVDVDAYFKRQKLNRDEVAEVKSLLRKGMPRKLIAEKYSISVQAVGMIARGEVWKEIA